MIRVHSDRVREVLTATKPQDLYGPLQAAIELEHATIPPYFTAFLSIKSGFMPNSARIIKSVFVEEMLHMTIVCNILNAIGGSPNIAQPGFIPTYPSSLPMHVDDDLVVHLAPLSKVQLELFMRIEEPEDPIPFPIKAALTEAAPEFATIGQFYKALEDKITELGDGMFTGNPNLQVIAPQWYPTTELFPILNVATALSGLKLIVQQGEGTPTSPLSGQELAHYYRFSEIYNEKTLVPDKSVKEGYSYSVPPIPFDPDGIWDMVVDPKTTQYAEGTRARTLVDQFNTTYTNLLNTLHSVFTGAGRQLGDAVGIMFELNIVGGQVVETTDTATGKQAAPTYEYLA